MTTQLKPITALEKNVARWANARKQDYNGDLTAVFRDLFYGGCASGMVGHLIYYKDTLAFFRKHRREIERLLTCAMNDMGAESPAGLFGDKWDKSDPLARNTQNQNLLAWFGFEESAHELCGRAEIDV